jgi:hypothetical protein
MNYTVEVHDLGAPRWWVIATETDKTLARCYTQEDAQLVANALNQMEPEYVR